MYKLLDISGAQSPTGLSFQRRLFRIKSGQYAGRLVLLYGKSASEIKICWSDKPYASWSSAQTILSDSADIPFSAGIDNYGHIHIAYTRQNSLDLIYLRLTFGAGNWNAGSPSTICNVGSCFNPSLVANASGELWCAYTYFDQPSSLYSARVKTSIDGGTSWSGGPASPGTALSQDNPHVPYVNLTYLNGVLQAIYSHSRSALYHRRQSGSAGGFSDPTLVFSADFFDDNFDCAISADFKLGIAATAFEQGRFYFREFDGLTFGGILETQIKARSPQLCYIENTPHIFCLKTIGNDFWIPVLLKRESASFAESNLIAGIGLFDSVLVYDDSAAGKFEDKTTAAANMVTGDIYHSNSNSLLGDINDCLYLGKDRKFYSVAVALSTPAAGGNIIWEYFNGSTWVQFTPASGSYGLDQSSKIVLLWDDLDSAPSNWQASEVNGAYRYWIRLRALSGFTTSPVGSQIAAAFAGRLANKVTEA